MHTMRTSKIILLLLLLTSTSIEAKERQKVVHHKVSIHKSKVNPLVGTASYYGPGFHGKKTASGERFNRHAYTAAHRSYMFGTRLKVCHKSRCVTVRVNDRGPFIKGRSIDLSEAAAKKIRCKGICRVTITIVRRHR